MNNPNQERCKCGDTRETYYPAENQYEPNCWDCYYQMLDGSISPSTVRDTPTDPSIDDLPF